ncbi:MAG TPA: lamin tail domain-containing protein, partial [Thermoanaerobaculia bacterium]|nr:lamin tail domain-containing protein [Thermoanaerobaculia bacterium]
MKRSFPRYALFAAALWISIAASGRGQPTELFFSEYIEGSSNNKALEIYNGTGSAVNLATGSYNVQMFFNGSASAGLTINLTGTVASGDVYVVAQSFANATILAQADQTNGSGWFNGDDAVVLRKGTTIVDVIGQIGFDPGTEWGTGLTSTADNTLRRKLTVAAGDTNGSDAFDPSIEWDGFATDTFSGLGCHTADPACSAPPAPQKEIFEIQGNGLASPLAGTAVSTSDNIVTGVFSDGFFIQTPDARADADPETSNGIFVFTSSAPTVSVGDQVDVIGTVSEFFNLTELNSPTISLDSSGNPLPSVVAFDENTPAPNQPQPATEMERFEGMLVRVVDGTVSSPTNQFSEASVVAASQRAFREPGILFPGLPGLPVWDGNPEIFEIDTDRFGASPGLRLAGGAIVTAEGPLAFSFGDYQIWPTSLEFTGEPRVVPVRDRSTGEFTVGTQNVLRLFDLVNDPDKDDDVPTPQQYADRLKKFSLLVRSSLKAPDVLVIQEAENLTVLQDLAAKIDADQLAASLPPLDYTPYLLEGNDIGGIDVGFLVRPTVQVDSVEQFGKDDLFEFPPNDPALLNDRPPLVLRGSYIGGTVPFPVVFIGVHQRSLSGIDGSDGARVRAKRYEQALRLSQYIQSLQTADPEIRLIVAGDFNAFEFTDGFVDVMGQVTGSPDPAGALLPATDEIDPDLTNQTLDMSPGERYSFVFDGTAQSLDHVLTSQALNSFVRATQHVRGNADAPFSFGVDATTSLRSSDHDGTVLFLMGDNDGDGFADDNDSCDQSSLSSSVVI